jgi:glycine cleavage system pyridoxal-binding protein P
VSSNEVTLQTAIESVFHADGSFYLVDAPQNYKIGTKGFNKWSNRTYTLKRVEFYQDSSVNEPRWTFYLETDTVSETITYQLTWNQYVDEYTNQFGMNIPNVSEKNVSLGVHNKTTAEKIQDLANELDNLDI